jgi:transcription termination/antitermination protein NusG
LERNGLFLLGEKWEGEVLNTLVQAVNTSVHHSSYALYPVVSDKPDWFGLFVRSKHEFVVEKELLRKNIETFLPTVQKFRQWTDRKKLITFPLFPGYLFVHMNPCPEEFSKVLKTPGSVKLLSSGNGNPTSVPTEEIHSLKIILENTGHFDIYPYLKEGSRIRIKKGPLKGIEGILTMKENQYLCIINIEILGRSIGVKIYADDLEAL